MKSDNDLKKAESIRKYEDSVRKMRGELDRTHRRSALRKPLEKAFKKLLSESPAINVELDEDAWD